MNRHRIIGCLAFALFCAASIAGAGATVGESPPFAFDTRDYLDALAAESAGFVFDTRGPDGLSAAATSGIFSFDTRAQPLRELTITGPAVVPSGGQASYRCFATYSDGRQEDVTRAAVWSVSAAVPAGTTAAGGSLQAGKTDASVAAEIRASYQTVNGQRTGALGVVIGGDLQVDFSRAFIGIAGNLHTLALAASSSGASGDVTYRWDTNNDGAFGDLVGQNVVWTLNSAGGAYRMWVEATDGAGRKAKRLHTIRIDKPSALNQPGKLAPANQVDGGNLLDKSGQPFQFVQDRIGVGLVVMTHGLSSGGTADWLVGNSTAGVHGMAASIEERLTSEGKPVPNLLIYDWGDDSDPNHFSLPDWTGVVSLSLSQSAFLPALAQASLSRSLFYARASDFITDIIGIRPIAYAHGQILANKILIEANASPARVDRTKPVHLIGHSAGGFLVGECGSYLKQRGFTVDMVTMLDTPIPYAQHLKADAPAGLPNPCKVERIITSAYGTLDIPEAAKVGPGDYYLYRLVDGPTLGLFTMDAHENGHQWYIESTIRGTEQTGFYRSPFLHGTTAPRGGRSSSMPLSAPRGFMAQSAPANPIDGFSPFGNVAVQNGAYSITEQADAGIFKELTVPVDVTKLRFRFKFRNAGDGDYLAVRFGERAEVFLGLDLELTRIDYLEAQVEFGQFAGITDKLVFTLVSRGAADAVLNVKDISFDRSDDADYDGLTTAQELAAGSDPQRPDTDGDGLDDAYEVNVSHTNPALADSDDDGQLDGAEIAAGTDPMDNHSVFAATDVFRAGEGFLLRWSGLASKYYRVLRSTTVDFGNFDVIASGIPGVAPTTTYTDTTVGTVNTPTAFYQIRTE